MGILSPAPALRTKLDAFSSSSPQPIPGSFHPPLWFEGPCRFLSRLKGPTPFPNTVRDWYCLLPSSKSHQNCKQRRSNLAAISTCNQQQMEPTKTLKNLNLIFSWEQAGPLGRLSKAQSSHRWPSPSENQFMVHHFEWCNYSHGIHPAASQSTEQQHQALRSVAAFPLPMVFFAFFGQEQQGLIDAEASQSWINK